MKLLPNENKLLTLNEDKIILTNLRIQMTDSVWGQSFSISIFLEDISSIESKYKSNIVQLIIKNQSLSIKHLTFIFGNVFFLIT